MTGAEHMLFVFDMDGTLTPPRLSMTAEFAIRFHAWQKSHFSFVATGSDYKKVEEQLPLSVISSFSGIYSSMGNVLRSGGKVVYQKEFAPDTELFNCLEQYRRQTAYPCQLFPNYIEQRIGMINFSVLGRDCPYVERNIIEKKLKNELRKILAHRGEAKLKMDLNCAVG